MIILLTIVRILKTKDMEERISITVNAFGMTHTAEINEDVSAIEFIEVCAKMAESVGYSPELVRKGLQAAKEYRE